MKQAVVWIWLLLLSAAAHGQTLTVVDSKTQSPLPGVLVTHQDTGQQGFTDANGELDLSAWPEAGLYQFDLGFYHSRSFTWDGLVGQDFTVPLNEASRELEGVTIQAGRFSSAVNTVPQRIKIIERQEVAQGGPQTSADMLSQSGQVFVQKSQQGGGSPMIRGFAANRVLIVVDGVRMNNAIYRSGNLQNVISVDPNLVESAEVLYGPGSVLYGSDALGGVMHFTTQRPEYSPADTMVLGHQFMSRYNTANQERTVHYAIQAKGRRWGLLAGASYSSFDDLRTGSRRPAAFPDFGKRPWYVARINEQDSVVTNPNPDLQVGSGFTMINGMFKFRWRPHDHWEVGYGAYLGNTGNIPRYDRLIVTNDAGEPRSAQWYYGPQTWTMQTLRATHSLPEANRFYHNLNLVVSYQTYEESRNDRGFGSDLLRTRTENLDIWTTNLDFEKSLYDFTLVYGGEGAFNTVQSRGFRRNIVTDSVQPTSTRYPDLGSTYQTWGGYLFVKYQSRVGDFSLGGRYQWVGLEGRFSDEFYDLPFNEVALQSGAWSGTASWSRQWSQKLRTSAHFGTGFRVPNIDDVAKIFDSAPGTVVVPNPNLQPEYSYNAEVGVTKYFGDKVFVEGTLFHTWLEGAMARRDFTFNGQDSLVYDGELSQVQALVNVESARIYGYSVQAEWQMTDAWRMSGTVSQTEGFASDGEGLRHVPPVFGRAAVVYTKDQWRIEGWTDFNGAKPYEELAPSELDKPYLYPPGEVGSLVWYTLNLRAQYRIAQRWFVQVAAENLLDRHYRTYSSGISAPGLNFSFSVRGRM